MVLFAGDFFFFKNVSVLFFSKCKIPPSSINPSSWRKNAGTIRLLVWNIKWNMYILHNFSSLCKGIVQPVLKSAELELHEF